MLARIDEGSDSPTSVESTPYIRFALDQLTRHENVPPDAQPPGSKMAYLDDYPVDRTIPDLVLAQMHLPRPELISNLHNQGLMTDHAIQRMTPEREREGMALTRKHRSASHRHHNFPSHISNYDRSTEMQNYHESQPQFMPAPIPPSVPRPPVTTLIPAHVPFKSTRNPPLDFIPMILRPLPMFLLAVSCIFMLVLLSLCAHFSRHDDLMNWYGRGSSQREFTMRFGPSIFATIIYLHIQGVMGAITRIMPFAILAEPIEARGRWDRALFSPLYPIMLRPARVGNNCIDFCMLLFWVSAITIPLQSSLFSLRTVSGRQRWFTVEIVAWVLIIMYSLLLGAVLMVGSFFFRRTTGLLWDPRSIADLIAMLPHSHSLPKFTGTDILKTNDEIRRHLNVSNLRLGYWHSPHLRGSDLIYGFSEISNASAAGATQKSVHRTSLTQAWLPCPNKNDVERGMQQHDRHSRFRFLPWYLRDAFIRIWSAVGFILWILIIFLVAFFLPKTTVFEKRLALTGRSTVDVVGNHTQVSFLLSFGPSLIGLVLYLLFQLLDMTVRILKPWTELSRAQGATADESLLLDYPASSPIYVSISAYAAGHYRIGTLSLFSTLFILLPIFAGGLFDPQVMLPMTHINQFRLNLPVLILILCLLTLYLVGIMLLLSHRYRTALPHGVSCLAEILSFIHNSNIVNDAAFTQARSKAELTTRLMAERTSGGLHRWAFGVFKGRDGNSSFGIERIGRNPGVGLMVMRTRLMK